MLTHLKIEMKAVHAAHPEQTNKCNNYDLTEQMFFTIHRRKQRPLSFMTHHRGKENPWKPHLFQPFLIYATAVKPVELKISFFLGATDEF